MVILGIYLFNRYTISHVQRDNRIVRKNVNTEKLINDDACCNYNNKKASPNELPTSSSSCPIFSDESIEKKRTLTNSSFDRQKIKVVY